MDDQNIDYKALFKEIAEHVWNNRYPECDIDYNEIRKVIKKAQMACTKCDEPLFEQKCRLPWCE